MATESTANEFGRVSRVKGRLFEALTFGASITGILALGVLLIYVSIDAFDLENASPEWLLVYFLALVVPYFGFCLYETDEQTKRLTATVLGGGLIITAAGVTAVETFLRPIPRVNWQLAYLFVVVLPITGYVSVATASTKTGSVGFGLLGRLIGGAALGLWIFIMFVVFDLQMWFLVYTLGIVPAAALSHLLSRFSVTQRVITRLGKVRQQPQIRAICSLPGRVADGTGTLFRTTGKTARLLIPAFLRRQRLLETVGRLPGRLLFGVGGRIRVTGQYASQILSTPALLRRITVVAVGGAGIAGALTLRESIPTYPTSPLILAWSVVLPASALVGVLTARRYNRRRGLVTAVVVFVAAMGGGFGLSTVTMTPTGAILLLLGVATPTVSYLNRFVSSGEGRAGLVLPVLLVGGAFAGAAIVSALGIASPDPWLDPAYVRGSPTTQVTQARVAGFFPPIVGSVLIITLVAILSFVLGVGTAVFLEEYTSDSGLVGAVSRLIQVNIANLAAVPSVVYGLLGLAVFVNLFGFGFGTAISASLTLSLLILPITVISAQEAIRSVPNELRDGSLAMGATRWQTTKNVVLPEAMPGILTGIILALGRAIGETAPLIMIGMANIAFNPPSNLFSRLSAMPMMIFQWAANPSAEFRFGVVAAGVVTLLVVLLTMNATAIIIRNKYERGT